MKISEMVEPTPEIINEAKRSYNRLLRRQEEAGRYLDSPDVLPEEKGKHFLAFRIEIVEPLNNYLQTLKDWGVEVTEDNILHGF